MFPYGIDLPLGIEELSNGEAEISDNAERVAGDLNKLIRKACGNVRILASEETAARLSSIGNPIKGLKDVIDISAHQRHVGSREELIRDTSAHVVSH